MTLQQLRYIIAVNEFHSFSQAARECNITQPTLSSMVQKMEHELGVQIFERKNKTVTTTPQGLKIIQRAEKTLREFNKIEKIASETNDILEGDLNMSVSPTIAQYILPDFISKFSKWNPRVRLLVKDMKMSSMINGLLDGSINACIGIAGNKRKGITEIPLYREPFMLYVSERNQHGYTGNATSYSEKNEMTLVMKEAVNLRESTFSFGNIDTKEQSVYESNSIDALIRIIDKNGGSTIIPQMHINYLSDKQRMNVVPINKGNNYTRIISLYVNTNDINNTLTKSIITVLRDSIPQNMLVK